jgi:acylglycerol lipase
MFTWKEDWFQTTPQLRIFYRACLPERVRGHVLVIHGYAEHTGRYVHVMEYLAERGYASYAPDHRGHGRTARCLGDMESFEKVVADLAGFKDFITTAYNARPLFILGHSLGGCLALCLSARHSTGLSGTVATDAAILIPEFASPLLIAISRVLSVLLPCLPVQAFPVKDICRDETVLEATRRDPLFYRGKVRARTGYQTIKGIRLARRWLPEITLPLLILHGGDDRVMPPAGSRFILDMVSSSDKNLIIFDHLYHEIMNEPEKKQPLSAIVRWLDAHNA